MCLYYRYIEEFGLQFLTSLKYMVNYELTESKALRYRTELFEEILHHLRFCKSKVDVFCGREELIAEIRAKLGVTFTTDKKQGKGEKIAKGDDREGKDKGESDVKNEVDADDNGEQEEKNVNEDTDEEEEDEEESMNETQQRNMQKEQENDQISEFLKKNNIKYVAGDSAIDTESDPQYNPKEKLTEIPESDVFHRPLVVMGKSGSGKTALMAKLTEMSKQWYDGCITVVRFMGTSAKSSSIQEVLVTVCKQIWRTYNIQPPTGLDIESNYQFLLRYFVSLLWQIDTSSKPLVIVFDSIDQLSENNHAHMFNWLPHKLPVGVFMLISVVSDRTKCLQNVQQVFPFAEQFVEITDLESTAASCIINVLSKKQHRHLARKQRNILLDLFAKCGQPLYLKLLMDMSLSWKSFTVVDQGSLGVTVKEVINHLFDNLEKKHGEKLIQKGIGMCLSLFLIYSTQYKVPHLDHLLLIRPVDY